MKNLLIASLIFGFMYFLGSSIYEISKMNTEKYAKIVLSMRGPCLDTEKVDKLVKSINEVK